MRCLVQDFRRDGARESPQASSRWKWHRYTPRTGQFTEMTSNDTTSEWDVVIVGAGPAGMAAALYTGRAKLRTLLLDRMGAGGGQLLNTELIEDYPAIKSITGSDMARDFEEQIRAFDVEVSWGEVVGVEARASRRVVKTDD